MKPSKDVRVQGGMKDSAALMAGSFDRSVHAWDRLLTCQAALFAEAEITHLRSLPEWARAQNILDVGCGNGEFTSRLCENFPDKTYYGIDISGSLIEIAQARSRFDNLHFQCADLDNAKWASPADLLLLRFVVQHLPDPRRFFEMLRINCSSAWAAIIIEPSVSESSVMPAMPAFAGLLEEYERNCRTRGNSRALISKGSLEELCEKHWTMTRVQTVVSQHDCETWNRRDLRQLLLGWIAALNEVNPNPSDLPTIREEVDDWIDETGLRADLALKVWVLRPRAASAEHRNEIQHEP